MTTWTLIVLVVGQNARGLTTVPGFKSFDACVRAARVAKDELDVSVACVEVK